MTTPDCDRLHPFLSALVDDDIDETDRRRVTAHLETCPDCRGLLDDLRQVRATAGTLGPMRPPEHIWLEIAGQVRLDEGTPPVARATPDAPPARSAAWQWAGLAAALALVTAGAYLFQGDGRDTAVTTVATSDAAGNATRVGTVEAVKDELAQAVRHYENAIAELETMARRDSDGMDTDMATVVQRNLGTIDQAITESRTALTEDPASAPARDSLFEALRQKVSVLQATVSLINQMRQGDAAGAARAAARGKQS